MNKEKAYRTASKFNPFQRSNRPSKEKSGKPSNEITSGNEVPVDNGIPSENKMPCKMENVGPPVHGDSGPRPFVSGIKAWTANDTATLDICFVHGLTGDQDSTWTAAGQKEPWPKALLPPKLPMAHIFTYGYEAYFRKGLDGVGTESLQNHASKLLEVVAADREKRKATSHPIIFVAHDLGGLVCKKVMLLSTRQPGDSLRTIFEHCQGILFAGTPHGDMWMKEWDEIPLSFVGWIMPNNAKLRKVVPENDCELKKIQNEFLEVIKTQKEDGRPVEIASFYEELPSSEKIIVSKEAATMENRIPQGIRATHTDMVRFSSVDDSGFKMMFAKLEIWATTVAKTRTKKEEAAMTYHNSGPGNQMISTGGHQHNNTGSGPQINGGNLSHFTFSTQR